MAATPKRLVNVSYLLRSPVAAGRKPASRFVPPALRSNALPSPSYYARAFSSASASVLPKSALNSDAKQQGQQLSQNPSASAILDLIPGRRATSGLEACFEPKSVAVIGATDRQGSVGRTIVNNLIEGVKGHDGFKIYPVNPSRQTCLGLPCFSSLSAVPGDVDMVVIVTPAKTCLPVMKECATKGVKAAVVISAGFKEAGPEGLKLEQDLIHEARSAGIRVIGPNCVGVMNPNFGLNATFASLMGLPGNVAFVSQSGAMCTSVLDWSLRENIGFSAFISVGSMADVNWGDLIDYLGDDPNTKSILIYMETIGDASAFLSAAKEVCLRKPIVVIKAGKSEAAAAAAASHTGSLAGSYKSFEAAMNRVGVLTVDTIQELFNCALVLGKQPRPLGPNLMIMTNAGGPAVLATDATVNSGGKIAKLEPHTLEALNKILPAAWSHSNPVDILGDASPELFASSLEIVLKDKNSDGILVILSPQDVTDPSRTAEMLVAAYKKVCDANGGKPPKPILASWMGGHTVTEGFNLLNANGIPAFCNPDDAATTFGKIWSQTETLESLYGRSADESGRAANAIPFVVSAEKKQKCIEIIEQAQTEGRKLLTEAESKTVLSAYGIPTVQTIIANTADEAEAAAKQIGTKLFVVKLNSKTLTHKTDVGGVKLNLKLEEVRDAYNAIQSSVERLHGAQHFEGVTVQPMVTLQGGLELILGSTCDNQFGPLVMFGSGGTMVEVFRDTALSIPPLNSNLANRLMQETKIYKALKGAAGTRFEGVDLEELRSLLFKFSQMVVDLGEFVSESDINPLLAMKDGYVALDARIALNSKGQHSIAKAAVRSYPSEYLTQESLSNGSKVTLRPVFSEDMERLKEFHNGLSAASLQLLTGEGGVTDVSVESLIDICHADYNRTLTIAAVDEKTGAFLGVLRLDRSPLNHLGRNAGYVRAAVKDDPSTASDIATLLMSRVTEIAAKEGIKSLQVASLVGDLEVLKTAEKKGWTCGDEGQLHVCRVEV